MTATKDPKDIKIERLERENEYLRGLKERNTQTIRALLKKDKEHGRN